MSIAICTRNLQIKKQRQKALAQDARITLINKENVVWLTKNYQWKWDMVVIDESSAFKNMKQAMAGSKAVHSNAQVLCATSSAGRPHRKDMKIYGRRCIFCDGAEARLFPTITGFRDAFFYLSVPEYFKYEVKKDCTCLK